MRVGWFGFVVFDCCLLGSGFDVGVFVLVCVVCVFLLCRGVF